MSDVVPRSPFLSGPGPGPDPGADALTRLMGLLRALRERWYVALLVAVPMIGGAVWYAEELPAVYESSAIVVVEPRPNEDANITPSVVALKGPAYVAYLSAPATLRSLAADLGLEPSDVEGALDAQLQSDTGIITVAAQSGSPDLSAAVAATAADALVALSADDELLQGQLLAPAIEPTSAAGPPRRLIQAAAIVVALGLAIVAAVLVDRRQPRVGRSEDVSSLTGWHLLGRLPRRRRMPDTPGLAFADTAIGTSIRALRIRLEADLRRGGSLTITSALPREGKTTLASLLATSLARGGHTVVLVDGDLRRPRLEGLLRDWQGPGLADVICGRAALPDSLVPGWTDNLTLLPTTADPEAGDAFGAHLPTLLGALRDRYDVVLVDAPPLLASDEAHALALATDRVVVAVASGTRLDAVSEAEATLAGLGASVAGYVLNRSTGSVSDAAAYGYEVEGPRGR